jgi:hypothetical protein
MQQKVKLPAIGLIVLGVLGILAAIFSLFSGTIETQQLIDANVPPEMAEQIAEGLRSGGRVLPIVSLLLSAFIAWAGIQMKNLKSWTAAVVANVLVMIPCITSCCCLVGLPLGIWGLVTLFNPEVRRSFEGQGTPV